MNPNPFASLNHFTVPVTIALFRCLDGTLPSHPQHVRNRKCNIGRGKSHPGRQGGPPGDRIRGTNSRLSFLAIASGFHGGARMAFDLSERASGILLHLTSLPGPHGSGDLGPEAHAFARSLQDAGQRWWQMLPVGPLGYGNSPYSAHSSFAGNPLLISLERLAEESLLSRAALSDAPRFRRGRVDYAATRS